MTNVYSEGKIYMISSPSVPLVYYGSTILTLTNRFLEQKNNFVLWGKGSCKYSSSFELLKYDDCVIKLLRLYPCKSLKALEDKKEDRIRYRDCVNSATCRGYSRNLRQRNGEQIRLYKRLLHAN